VRWLRVFMCVLLALGAGMRLLAAEGAKIRSLYPPELAVEVGAGQATLPDGATVRFARTKLTFARPEIRRETLEAPSAGPITLKPKLDTLLLGSLFRSVVDGSVAVASVGGRMDYALGKDYTLDPMHGIVTPIPGRMLPTLKIVYDLVSQRLDLVQVGQGGRLSVKQGKSAVVCPELPAPDADAAALAGIYIHTANHPGQVAVTPEDIYPIRPSPPVAPINAKALAGSLAKLKAGKNLTVAFFGDSITLGAEAGPWWSDRSKTYTGLVVAELGRRFPNAAIFEVPAWRGAINTVTGRATFENRVLPMTRPKPGEVRRVVWWEAEKPKKTNFPASTWYSPKTPAEADRLSGGTWLTAGGERDGAALFAAYEVAIPEAARYTLFARKFSTHGAFKWQIDDGPWRECGAKAELLDHADIRRYVSANWVALGEVELKAGAHAFRFELLAGEGEKQVAGFDCFALAAGRFRPMGKARPRTLTVDSAIWWEGEKPAAHNFPQSYAFVPIGPEQKARLSGGAWLQTDQSAPGAHLSARYPVSVPQTAKHTLFARAFHTQSGGFRWRFDDQTWTTCRSDAKPLDSVEFRKYVPVNWLELGSAQLSEGTHTLHVELLAAPGKHVAIALDCFALTTGKFRPSGTRRPTPGDRYLDLLVIALGMNDSRVPIDRFKAHLRRYVHEARDAGMEVVLVTPIAPSPWVEQEDERGIPKAKTAAAIRGVAAEMGVACADVYTEWMNQAARGIPPFSQLHNWNNHPGEAGMRLYADVILRFFE